MFFEEPKVEYIAIEENDVIVTSGGSPSGEDCIGPDAPHNVCASFM